MNLSLKLEAGCVVGVFERCWEVFGEPFKTVELEELADLVAELRRNKCEFQSPPPAYIKYITAPALVHPRRFDWSRVPESTLSLMRIRQYQIDAINTIADDHNWRSVLAACTGSGKTLLGTVFATGFDGPVLFLVPSAKCPDWIIEFRLWTGGEMTEVKTRTSKLGGRVVVCSYDKAKNNPHVYNTAWSAVVVDECHMLKHDNATTQVLIPRILQPCPAVLLMSGTPLESGTAELFNLLRVMDPATFKSRKEFTARYSDGHVNAWGVWEERGAKNLDELNLIANKRMIRIRDDVLELPPITRVLVPIDWKETDSDCITELEQARDKLYEEKNAELAKVRQGKGSVLRVAMIETRINCKINEIHMENGRIKAIAGLEKCREILERHPNDGVVFFTYNVPLAKQLQASLKEMGYESLLGTGELTVKARLRVLNALRDGKSRIGVLTLDACGTGFNLCPGSSVVVFIQMHHNEGKMEQGEGRLHRIGAVRPVFSYWFVLTNSRDEGQYTKLQSRKNVNSRVLDGEVGKITFKKQKPT